SGHPHPRAVQQRPRGGLSAPGDLGRTHLRDLRESAPDHRDRSTTEWTGDTGEKPVGVPGRAPGSSAFTAVDDGCAGSTLLYARTHTSRTFGHVQASQVAKPARARARARSGLASSWSTWLPSVS